MLHPRNLSKAQPFETPACCCFRSIGAFLSNQMSSPQPVFPRCKALGLEAKELKEQYSRLTQRRRLHLQTLKAARESCFCFLGDVLFVAMPHGFSYASFCLGFWKSTFRPLNRLILEPCKENHSVAGLRIDLTDPSNSEKYGNVADHSTQTETLTMLVWLCDIGLYRINI